MVGVLHGKRSSPPFMCVNHFNAMLDIKEHIKTFKSSHLDLNFIIKGAKRTKKLLSPKRRSTFKLSNNLR